MPYLKLILDTLRIILFVDVIVITSASILLCSSSESDKKMTSVKVAGIILKWVPTDLNVNYTNAERLIRQAAIEGADIVCTTECFLDGYSVGDVGLTIKELHNLAEPIPNGEYVSKIMRLADELNIYIIAAITERDNQSIYNSAILIGPDGKLIGKYRKNYLWTNEVDRYIPGKGFPVFDTEFGKVGIMICSERRYSSAIKELTLNGADIVFCPAGGGYGKENDQIVSKRSKEGKVHIVFVHPIEFLVTGPSGEILTSSSYGDKLIAVGGKDKIGVVRFYNLHFPEP